MSKKNVYVPPKKRNKYRNYRLSIKTALKLGKKPSKCGRYRLNNKQEKAYFELDQYSIKRLFYDIETSQYELDVKAFDIRKEIYPNFNHVKRLAKIICISYKWEGEDTVKHLFWDKDMNDKSMVERFVKILNQADEIVGHNADRFDLPWIRTRALYHQIPMKVKYRSFDTLKKARAMFRFPNNKLDTIAKYLGVGAKVSHSGIKMWSAVQNNDRKALKEMVHYCDGDVIVLEDVFFAMQHYVNHNTNVAAHVGGLKAHCPLCASSDVILLQNNYTALGTIKRQMECGSCGYSYETSNSAYRELIS